MKATILIADDEAFIRQAYQDGLERVGCTVLVAEDGQTAMESIRQYKPDIVLLDLIMPKLNGFEVLKEVKADAALCHIPVIVLSNLSQHTDEAEVKKLGAEGFLIKSDYSLKEIIEQVQSALDAASSKA